MRKIEMKKILLILIASATLCACDNGRTHTNRASKDSTAQVDSDSIAPKDLAELQQKYIDLNYSIRDNSSRIESVEQSLNDSKRELDSKVDKRLVYVLIGICVLLLILVVVALLGIHNLQKSRLKIKNSLASLETAINRLKDEGTVVNNRASGRVMNDYRDDIDSLKRQIEALKGKVDITCVSKGKPIHEPEPVHKQTPSPVSEVKRGYFGVNDNRGRIGNVYMSATEEAVFQYYAKSDSIVEFEPLNLMRIKSIPSIRNAVDILEGSLQDATEMKVVKRGQAVRREQNGQKYWEITLPAQIKLK